jgi:hypothetical protein
MGQIHATFGAVMVLQLAGAAFCVVATSMFLGGQRRLAKAAAIVSMVPLAHPLWVLGVPAGIWYLVADRRAPGPM